MKISSADLVFSSDHQFEQMDVSLEEKTEQIKDRQAQKKSWETINQPQVRVDRVSFSQNGTREIQSNYTAETAGHASVRSIESDEVVTYDQTSAMEQIIGGIIETDVVIHRLQTGQDIQMPETAGSTSPVPESEMPLIQTRLAQPGSDQTWEMSVNKTDIHFEEERIDFSSSGNVTTEDGRQIDFSLDMSLNRTFLARTQTDLLVQKWQEKIALTDPLVISLDGSVPQLSDARFEFDLNADGEQETIGFVSPGSGFLAFDRNHDAIVNDGSELFGPGTGNGFEELAAFDEDQNRWIDENDAVFSTLSVWTKDETGEDRLISLKDAGIGAIALDYAASEFKMTDSDNQLQGQLKGSGMFLFENGNAGNLHQIDLASQPIEKIRETPLDAPVREPQGTTDLVANTRFPTPPLTEELSEREANPLKDLLDRIKKLKQDMERLYEKINSGSRQNRFRRSKMNAYQQLNPDLSLFMYGDKGQRRRSGRRYI